MTMLATRVGRLGRELAPSMTRCYRCGHEFNHHEQNVRAGSPCRDCRDILRREGDATVWRRQPHTPKPRESA